MKLRKNTFLNYKLLNSSFTGISIGILFQIYQPLTPTTYSIGGILLATCMLIVAKFYEKLLNIKCFYYVSIMVEFIMLLTIIIFLLMQYSLTSALLIYIGYQFTFIFGGYLVRAETLITPEKEFLGKLDIYKQIGYLEGIACSFLFYKALEYSFDINEPKAQIGILHYFLIILQLIIITLLVRSFKKNQ